MITLQKFLDENTSNQSHNKIILACALASKEIYASIRLTDTIKDADKNSSGDTQSKLDILSDAIFINHLTETSCVRTIASEEQQDLVNVPTSTEENFVAYDPYDGGGVGDVNMTFGSIIGLWSQNPLGGIVGRHLVAGCYSLYGPRLTFVVSLGDAPTIFEYDQQTDTFVQFVNALSIAPTTTHCSPGNFRNIKNDSQYASVMQHWIAGNYKLLYGGALVTDVNHILSKGHGIFTYPTDNTYPTGKLRLLYEGGPLGFMIEAAGGKALSQSGTRLLDIDIDQTHQRETFVLGSSTEVDTVVKLMRQS